MRSPVLDRTPGRDLFGDVCRFDLRRGRILGMSIDPHSTARPSLLTIAEVADRLGVQVRHVRRLVNERRIPFVKWGHLLRFDPEEIEAWLDRSRVHPGEQRGVLR
jgi:excisionase family DNA binding protein